MKTALRYFIFLFMITFFSCEKQVLFVNCSDCITEEPVKTDLAVKCDFNYSGGSVLINVYEGNLEDNVLYSSFSVTGTKTTVPVTLNKKYTVTATYYIPGDYFITVDSATPMVKYTKDQCDNPCYFVYDRNIDLRLRKAF
jgi:hypothetical protein